MLQHLLSVTVLALAKCDLWKISLEVKDDDKIKFEFDNLILLNDVAGDVGGDRDILVQAHVDLDNKDKSAVAKNEEILELFNPFQDPYFCFCTQHIYTIHVNKTNVAPPPLVKVYNKLSISGRG